MGNKTVCYYVANNSLLSREINKLLGHRELRCQECVDMRVSVRRSPPVDCRADILNKSRQCQYQAPGPCLRCRRLNVKCLTSPQNRRIGLKACPDAVASPGPEGKYLTANNLLVWAAERGYVRLAELLITQSPVRLGGWNSQGRTLPLVVRNGRIERAPLTPGCSIVTQARDILLVAAENRRKQLVSLFVRSRNCSDICTTITRCLHDPETLRVILEAAKLKLSENRWSLNDAFSTACRNGRLAAIDLLLKFGLDPSLEFLNKTLRHVAAVSGAVDIVQRLLLAGADPTARDRFGRTTLHYAVRRSNNCETVDLLLRSGANPDEVSLFGDTPVMLATMYTRYEDVHILDSLLKAGANPNIVKWRDNTTALHYASQNYYPLAVDIIARLLRAGADIHARDSNGFTPLHLAVRCHNIDIVKQLLAEGASVLMLDNEGRTPCEWATGTTAMVLYSHWFRWKYGVQPSEQMGLTVLRAIYMTRGR